jgi:hypothetical protein
MWKEYGSKPAKVACRLVRGEVCAKFSYTFNGAGECLRKQLKLFRIGAKNLNETLPIFSRKHHIFVYKSEHRERDSGKSGLLQANKKWSRN